MTSLFIAQMSQHDKPSTQVSASDWTFRQRQFMLWLATPSVQREPLTILALSKELGVDESTLHRWKHLPGFREEVNSIITASLSDNYHDVMYAFKQEAAKGSFQHERMYFEMMGVYVEKHEVKGTLNVEGSLSDDDLIARADTVIARRAKDTP